MLKYTLTEYGNSFGGVFFIAFKGDTLIIYFCY